MTLQLPVLVQTPAHSNLGGALSYESDTAHPPGTLVRVPLGQREILGIVWDTLEEAPALDPVFVCAASQRHWTVWHH